ncbi:hypothetical protein LWC34_36435 [Kibdelosporangium philippinense]|uniref:Uncharacterized protein n=1 Tax=Kibdelosporangium philippinense TaxID=211113 RepID=A0ABS8ZKC8_9PSEU|nr:hypothetical protein [Kibdelosporangium philippinense]MCE7008265.1 hypothetical protein [Kibdelosporangium philippinense]
MGIVGNYRLGRKFVKWLGDEVLDENLIVVETFYYSPISSRVKGKDVVALALSEKVIYLSGLTSDLKRSAWRQRIPVDDIRWLDVDARSVDYPWILESTCLAEAVELSSTGRGTRVPQILADLLLGLDGLEVTLTVGTTGVVVDYMPWRPNSPGGWMGFRVGGDQGVSLDDLVSRVQAHYRGLDNLQGLNVRNVRRIPFPGRPADETLAHALVRSVGMARPSEVTVGLDERGKPHVVGVDGRRVAVVAIPEDSVAASPRPRGAISDVDKVSAEMSLYSTDMNAITLRVPGCDAVKFDGSDLDGDWEKLAQVFHADSRDTSRR